MEVETHTDQMQLHYATVRYKALTEKKQELRDKGVSQKFLDTVLEGLSHWVRSCESEIIQWGWFECSK